ncbi:MAG TPA: hypothetical protein PLG30_14915 [Bacteroidia bacterium]|nr:hypothetical protein [Bacteroidia bacterium]
MSKQQNKINLIDPNKVKGFYLSGVPKKAEYKKLIDQLKEKLSDMDFVFASIIQLHIPKVIENTNATLAVAFDETKLNSQEKYDQFLNQLKERLTPVINNSGLEINLLTLDRRESILKDFMKPTAWTILIKDQELYNKTLSTKRSWWKFWHKKI